MTDQISFADINPEYEAFVEKFKPKKTTDDCYTPENIYEAVAGWVADEYGRDRAGFLRPFWPGKDYQTEDYPEGCTVVDNPPFSLRSQIVAFYMAHGVPFFLFSPSLTLLTGRIDVCHIVTDTDITYANGAVVRTAFVTNLEDCVLRTAPELRERVDKAEQENRKKGKKELPKYAYPDHILTAAIAQRWAHYGVEFRLARSDAIFIRAMDAQHAADKTIFGGGLLLSDRAAAERAAAERAAEHAAAERGANYQWELSEREKRIVRNLSGGGGLNDHAA